MFNMGKKGEIEYQYVLSKIKDIDKTGIVLLRDLSEDKVNNINKVAYHVLGIKFRSFLYDNVRYGVFIKHTGVKQNRELINFGNSLYRKGEYTECIKVFRSILEGSKVYHSNMFIKLGLSYYKLEEFETSLDYLIIGSYYVKKEGFDRDYSNLISRIEKKITFFSEKQDFEYKSSRDSNIEGVLDLVVNYKISIDDAFLRLSIPVIKRVHIILDIVEECYIQEEYAMGDKYLNIARKYNKTPDISKRIREIEKRRLFYKNRKDEGVRLKLYLTK